MNQIETLSSFLNAVEKLKCITRHSWTSTGRHESVAEHTWRFSLMVLLFEDEFTDLDITRVIKMCIIHDLGEIYKGDVPAFEKKEQDELDEIYGVEQLFQKLPLLIEDKFMSLWTEFNECKTEESKFANALDKMEAVIQHNNADLSTWIPVEKELNLTYGEEASQYNPFLKKFREYIKQQSIKKCNS